MRRKGSNKHMKGRYNKKNKKKKKKKEKDLSVEAERVADAGGSSFVAVRVDDVL
jgi:hypothetical protein